MQSISMYSILFRHQLISKLCYTHSSRGVLVINPGHVNLVSQPGLQLLLAEPLVVRLVEVVQLLDGGTGKGV